MSAATLTPDVDVSEQLGFALPANVRELDRRIRYVPWALIQPDPDQPRVDADDELRESIRRNGIIQPITVRPHADALFADRFMIVDGERRWRGAEDVLEEIPCIVRDDQEDEALRLRTQLVANTGKPLGPLEEARAFAKLLTMTGRTQSELAEDLGRAKSTVNDRLGLLELGPWVAKIEAGELPLSHAVRVLLPLRTMPDDIHAKAIAKAEKDWRWQNKGGGTGISLGDFERLISQVYRPYFYPLAKTKVSYDKQPEFNTKDHARECECGGIKFDFGNGRERMCCGNPHWWGPLHRKAVAAKPKAKSSADRRPSGPRIELPSGTPSIKGAYSHDVPKNVVALTDTNARWDVRSRDEGAFDPSDLSIDDTKLVRLTSSYGGDRVGTKDLAAVKAARAAWADRWAARRVALTAEFTKQLKQHANDYPVKGVGALELLLLVAPHHPADLLDIARAHGLEVPDALLRAHEWELGGKVSAWLKKLEEKELFALAVGVAVVNARNLVPTSRRLGAEHTKALEAIQKRQIPWLAKAKTKSAKGKTAPSPADEENEDEDEDVDDGAGDDAFDEDDA